MVKAIFQRSNLGFRDKVFSLDYILIFSILLLGAISFFAMYSTERGNFEYHTLNHIYRFFIFFAFFLLLSFFEVQFWNRFAYWFYGIILILLILVNFYGITSSGSTRWINLYFINLQPSELVKISLIIFLARYYNKIPSRDVNNIKFMLLPVIIIFVPVVLIIKQPDLGTALLIALSGLAVIWLAGFRVKYFIFSVITFICLTPVAIAFLKPYQKSRILTFFNPERDPLGAGYQIIQSKIAVGSGGMVGKGFLKGTQSYLDYLPEKHTDFIFTLFSEEFGFVGSLTLLILYLILLLRIIKIGQEARSYFAKFYCFGFSAALFIYITVNMSMVLGLLPIVGSPLPIMSYGGSALLATMIGFSIVMSCKIYSREVIS